ncbi:hypothetical protein DVH05_000318 [Phytophthora capsici]|nr:hypothetical protein DVH05_000318 [Phytophthora capsici]
MTDLITTDEVLFDDIVGLLDSSEPLTPRAFEDESTDPAVVFTAPAPGHNAVQASTNPTDGAKTDKQKQKRELEKTRQRRYRQKMKDIRDELQQQVDELTQELHQFTQRKFRKTQLKAPHRSRQLTSSCWALAADRQRQQRVMSEEEHKKLLAAVKQQAEYIKELQRAAGDVPYFVHTPTKQFMTCALYTNYLQQLEGCYARVDRVLNDYSMASLPTTTYNSIQRRQDDGEVAFFLHLNKVALPYSFGKTCEVLWTVTQKQEEPAYGDYEIAPDDGVFIKSRVLWSLNVGRVSQRLISRFYKEKDRLVLVWKMSSEGEGAFSGLHAEETAWMIVRPTATGVMLEVCIQQVPMRLSVSSTKEPDVAKFHNLLQESLEQDKKNMVMSLMKLLLEDV